MPTCFSPTFEFVYTNTPFCWSWMKSVAHMWKRIGRTRFSRQHLEQRKELDIRIRDFVPPFLSRKQNHLYLEIHELWFEQPDEFSHIVDSSAFIFLTNSYCWQNYYYDNKSTENLIISSRQKAAHSQWVKNTRSQNQNQEHGLGSAQFRHPRSFLQITASTSNDDGPPRHGCFCFVTR